MSLSEGEYIKHIEECDDGWWSGIGRGGKTGLFPCLWFSIQAATIHSELSFFFAAQFVRLLEGSEPPPPPVCSFVI
jgi:hypothetical protein